MSGTEALRLSSLQTWRAASSRWGVLLIHVTLTDLDDIALGIAHPDGAPSRDEVPEVERPQRDRGISAHLPQLGIDVVHLKGEVPPARVVRTVLISRGCRRFALSAEQFQIHAAGLDEDDL